MKTEYRLHTPTVLFYITGRQFTLTAVAYFSNIHYHIKFQDATRSVASISEVIKAAIFALLILGN